MTSLSSFKHISKKISIPWRLWDVSKTYLLSVRNFSKIQHKMVSCDFHRITEISVKIDVGQLETLKKWNVFREQYIVINQICHEYQWNDKCVKVLASQRSSNLKVSALFTTFSDFFRLIRLYITGCHCLKYRNLGEVSDKKLRNQICIKCPSFL